MSPEQHFDRQDKDIQREQARVDALDKKTDQKIQTNKELTTTYIDRVNNVQGHLRDIQKKLTIRKDMRSPEWQKLENTSTKVATDMINALKIIDEKNVTEQADAFNAKVDEFLAEISGMETIILPETSTEKEAIPLSAEKIFNLWGITEKTTPDFQKKVAKAVENYGVDAIRRVQTSLALLQKLPPQIVKALFPELERLPSRGAVAGQLMFGTLDKASPLLQSPEERVRAAREKGNDQLSTLQDSLKEKQKEEADAVKILSTHTTESASDQKIQKDIRVVTGVRSQIKKLQQEMAPVGQRIVVLDLAMRQSAIADARSGGRSEEANRLTMRAWEEYGPDLQTMDPAFYEEVKTALGTLKQEKKLTAFEEKLYGKTYTYQQSLEAAVEKQNAMGDLPDVIDQLRANRPFTMSAITAGVDFFKDGLEVRNAKNDDISTVMKSYSYVTITSIDGTKITCALGTDGATALQKIPAGTKPILLRDVPGLNFRLDGKKSTIKSTQHFTCTNKEVLPSVLQKADIGYVDNQGKVVDSQGEQVDITALQDAEFVEKQIARQRAFTVRTYAAPNGTPLRDSKNQPFDSELFTLKTAAGKTYEGVMISASAKKKIAEVPPAGMTLVLKRPLENIQLSATRFEGGGRYSAPKTVRKVLLADTIEDTDLLYAKTEGDTLQMQSVNGEKLPDASIAQTEKQRDENTRDVLRSLDRDPAVQKMNSQAGGLQHTLVQLQDMLAAGGKGSKRQAFVDFARDAARPALDMINSPDTLQNLQELKGRLMLLRDSNTGIALSGLEQEIDQRLRAIDGFIAQIESGAVRNILQTVLDASKFDADTWKNWILNDGAKLLITIAAAVAATVYVIATFGTGALVLAAVAGAGAGLIGGELASEAVYYGNQFLSEDVRSGKVTFTERSAYGKAMSGVKIFDPATNTYVDMDFNRDVLSPYAQQFAISFATQLVTMGLVKVSASFTSKLVSNSKLVQQLADTKKCTELMGKLARLKEGWKNLEGKLAGKLGAGGKKLIDFAKEFGDELTDEVLETGLGTAIDKCTTGLEAFDVIASAGVGVVIGTLKGTRLRTRKGDIKRTIDAFRSRGLDATVNEAGNGFIVTSVTGETVTIPVDIDAQNPEGVDRSSEATPVEAETVPQTPSEIIAAKRIEARVVSADPEHATYAQESARESYERNEVVQQAKSELLAVINENFDTDTARELTELTEYTLTLYVNTDQYHSGEHMLTMTRDIMELAQKGGLEPDRFKEVLKRGIVSGQYHDTGNGRNPDITPGIDEAAAAKVFLRDVAEARRLQAAGQPLGRLAALGNLTDADVRQIAGNIVGTVFADRVCDAEFIANQKYCSDTAQLLSDMGIETASTDLSQLALNNEALIVKNADILASLKPENILRNGMTNFSEDTRKEVEFLLSDDPAAKHPKCIELKEYYLAELAAGRQVDPQEFRRRINDYQAADKTFPGFKMPNIGKNTTDYRSGFNAFLKGIFTRQRTPPTFAPAATEHFVIAQRSPLIGNAETQQYGRELSEAAGRKFAIIIENDGQLIDAMQNLLSADALGNPQQNLIGRPLSEIAVALEASIGTTAFEPYRQGFEKYRDRTIATMSPEQVNEVFTSLHTRQLVEFDHSTHDGTLNVIAVRNRSGASPETTQVAANALVQDRVSLAKAVGDLATRAEAVARYNQLSVASGGKTFSEADIVKNCEKFVTVVAAIESGAIGLEGNYVGSAIRDLNKLMPGLDMEAKLALDRTLHEAAMRNENIKREAAGGGKFDTLKDYMDWLLSPDQTIEGGRPATPEGKFAEGAEVNISNRAGITSRLNGVIDAMNAYPGSMIETFSRASVEKVLERHQNPAIDAMDRTILLETASVLEKIIPTAGESTLPSTERWKILEFSARYLQDFRASPNFKATPQQLLDLVVGNAVNLSHQNIMDHMTLVGSSHGTLHVLRGNAELLHTIFDQLGFTPEMRVLALQADFNHDDGYGKRTLVGKKPQEGVFDSSKDHPLESTLQVEANREWYEQIFGRDGYITIRNAVLDHSDAMGKNDRQFENYATKLDVLVDPNAPAADRVGAALALVDCLATVNNLKTSPLFRENPEILATMARIQLVHNQMNVITHRIVDDAKARGVDTAGQKKEVQQSREIQTLRDEAKAMRQSMQQRIALMDDIPKATKEAYLRSLDSTMQWEHSDFALSQNFQMLAASLNPALSVDADGKVHVTYIVDPHGLATIAQVMDPKSAEKFSRKGIEKAAEDFGDLTPGSKERFETFMRHAMNLESSDRAKQKEAEEYFAKNKGVEHLETNSRLVMDLTIGKNIEYRRVQQAIDNSLYIDSIRGFARANIDALIRGEPITIEGIFGNKVEIDDPQDFNRYAQKHIARYIEDLPQDYVMHNAAGQYVPVVEAFEEARAAAKDDPVTWKAFADRMIRTAGSRAPLSRRRAA